VAHDERATKGVMDMARVPVAEGVFAWPSDDPQLIGSRCGACGIVTFPGERQVPGDPKVGYTQLYGAPGVAGVSILSV
jgi:uncharacterized OB-fold protein